MTSAQCARYAVRIAPLGSAVVVGPVDDDPPSLWLRARSVQPAASAMSARTSARQHQRRRAVPAVAAETPIWLVPDIPVPVASAMRTFAQNNLVVIFAGRRPNARLFRLMGLGLSDWLITTLALPRRPRGTRGG